MLTVARRSLTPSVCVCVCVSLGLTLSMSAHTQRVYSDSGGTFSRLVVQTKNI